MGLTVNKDAISLLFTVVTGTAGVIATTYQHPVVGVALFAIGVGCYLLYITYVAYTGSPGNQFMRFLPVLVLLAVGGVFYWFWPSSLQIEVFVDQNENGQRDAGEPGVRDEELALIDVSFLSRLLKTDNEGRSEVQSIPLGAFQLKLRNRNMVIQGNIERGRNQLKLGFMPQLDKTRPKTRIFLGDELGFSTNETFRRRVYAHLWFQDAESGIEKVEIDWGEGRGWETVDLDLPTMRYHVIEHEYQRVGKKTVKFRATNQNNLSSLSSSEPPRPGVDFHVVEIRSLPVSGGRPAATGRGG